MLNHARFSVWLGGTSLDCDVFRGAVIGSQELESRSQEVVGVSAKREWAKRGVPLERYLNWELPRVEPFRQCYRLPTTFRAVTE
jgi:hypothetical protein